MKLPGVDASVAHLCQYGLEYMGEAVKKATRFISNAQMVLAQLQRRCEGVNGKCSRTKGGSHRHCKGKVAAAAQQYSRGTCKAILRGMHNQFKASGYMEAGMVGLQAVMEQTPTGISKTPAEGYSGKYHDDLSGEVLNDALVQEARAQELRYFEAKGVWQKIVRADARRFTARRPVSVR